MFYEPPTILNITFYRVILFASSFEIMRTFTWPVCRDCHELILNFHSLEKSSVLDNYKINIAVYFLFYYVH